MLGEVGVTVLSFLLLQVAGSRGDLRVDLALGRRRFASVDCVGDEGTVAAWDDQVVICSLTCVGSVAGHHLRRRVRVHRLMLNASGHL